MKNLLTEIDIYDLEDIVKEHDFFTFKYINLHCKNKEKVENFLKDYFAIRRDNLYYTSTSSYLYYQGACYKLVKATNTYYLVYQDFIEEH